MTTIITILEYIAAQETPTVFCFRHSRNVVGSSLTDVFEDRCNGWMWDSVVRYRRGEKNLPRHVYDCLPLRREEDIYCLDCSWESRCDYHRKLALSVRRWEQLSPAALASISERQRSYIDEFTFHQTSDDRYDAMYAGELIAIWDGEMWLEPGIVGDSDPFANHINTIGGLIHKKVGLSK